MELDLLLLSSFAVLLFLVLPLKGSQAVVASNSSISQSIEVDTTVRCVCDGECERILEEDCRWGMTLDFCGCCLLCSRGEGEPCGGALGTCAYGLYCASNDAEKIGEGICAKPVAGVEKVCENPVSRYGCLFHGGTCICESQTVCPEMEMFLFDTEESCRSRVAILMQAIRQDEATEDKDLAGGAGSEPGERATVNCSEVICEVILDCPSDSYRLPSSVHSEGLRFHAKTNEDCCPAVHKCQCNPGHSCPKPECPPGWKEKFVVNSTGEPGNCCPLLECSPSGTIQGCTTTSGRAFNNSAVWKEDECTVCSCEDGKVKCHAMVCQARCDHPIYSPGKCCPICLPPPEDLLGSSDDGEDGCPQVDCVGRECTGGYLLDVHGCPTCQCNECLALDCSLDCPLGFTLDSHGCPQCSCALPAGTSSASQLDFPKNEHRRSNIGGCTSLDEKHGVIVRAESDEWWDGCRHCVCKDGLEMCTLISCNPPECEQPIFYPGDCCPRCPGDEVPMSQQIDTTCKSSHTWKVNKCLTCSCYNSLVHCSHPICPPAPCEVDLIGGRSHNDPPCCHTCAASQETTTGEVRLEGRSSNIHPSSTKGETRAKVGNISSMVVGMRKCFSDDNHEQDQQHYHRSREYDDGESWTTGPCQSCICRKGKIECFSSWRSCPPLSCDQPVFAKNQCCPICLELSLTARSDSHGKSSDLNPLVATVLVVLLCLIFILALFTVRCVFQRRRSRRRLGDTSNKPAPNYC